MVGAPASQIDRGVQITLASVTAFAVENSVCQPPGASALTCTGFVPRCQSAAAVDGGFLEHLLTTNLVTPCQTSHLDVSHTVAVHRKYSTRVLRCLLLIEGIN